MVRGIASLFSGKIKALSNRGSKRQQSEDISAQLEEAEASGNDTNVSSAVAAVLPAGYAPAPVSSSSSSWSSNPPEVPYASAGGTASTSMNTSARQLALQAPSQQSQHWMPTPQYLAAAAQSSIKNVAVPPNLQATHDRTSTSSSSKLGFPSTTFPSTETTTITKRPNPSHAASSGPRMLHRKKTRFQEFTQELSELIQDLMEYTKAKTWKKKVMAVVLCLSSVLVFYDLIFGHLIIEWLHRFILWMSLHSIEAVFAFLAIFVVATCKYLKERRWKYLAISSQSNLTLQVVSRLFLYSDIHSTYIIGIWSWLCIHRCIE
jgi:hypothetical protein